MIHNLKILPQYFEPVIMGIKTFELRKDDRNYQINDILELKEWDGQEYTGREMIRQVTYKLKNAPGMNADYCILGIDEVD